MQLKALPMTLTFCIFHNCTYCHLKTEQIWSFLSNYKQVLFFSFCNSLSLQCWTSRTVTQGSHFLVSARVSTFTTPTTPFSCSFVNLEGVSQITSCTLIHSTKFTDCLLYVQARCWTHKNSEGLDLKYYGEIQTNPDIQVSFLYFGWIFSFFNPREDFRHFKYRIV